MTSKLQDEYDEEWLTPFQIVPPTSSNRLSMPDSKLNNTLIGASFSPPISSTTHASTMHSSSTTTELKSDQSGFFYIIKTPDVPEGVYKIGKTCQVDPNKRLCRYPTYSCCLYTIHVANADLFEDLVMRKLKGSCKRRMEYGLEYYESDIRTLINEVHQLWLKYGSLVDFQLDKSNEKNKPNGWQYFANEWLAKNPNASADEAYLAYTHIMKSEFMSNEYAEFEYFERYFKSLQI